MTARVEFYGVSSAAGVIYKQGRGHHITELVVETATGVVRIVLHGENERAVTPSLKNEEKR